MRVTELQLFRIIILVLNDCIPGVVFFVFFVFKIVPKKKLCEPRGKSGTGNSLLLVRLLHEILVIRHPVTPVGRVQVPVIALCSNFPS